MDITLPDDILRRAEANESDVRLAVAVQLYADNRIDHADACRLARTSTRQLNRALLRSGLGVQLYPGRAATRNEAG